MITGISSDTLIDVCLTIAAAPAVGTSTDVTAGIVSARPTILTGILGTFVLVRLAPFALHPRRTVAVEGGRGATACTTVLARTAAAEVDRLAGSVRITWKY